MAWITRGNRVILLVIGVALVVVIALAWRRRADLAAAIEEAELSGEVKRLPPGGDEEPPEAAAPEAGAPEDPEEAQTTG